MCNVGVLTDGNQVTVVSMWLVLINKYYTTCTYSIQCRTFTNNFHYVHTGGLAVLSAVLLFVVSVALLSFSIYCSWLSGAQSRTQNIVIYRNNTILATRQALSSAFTASVNFVLMSYMSYRPDICYYDCTNISPRTRPFAINVTRTSAPEQTNSPSTIDQKRLVLFYDNNDVKYASTFMLGGSNVSFSVTGLDHTTELYILKNATSPSNFSSFFDGSNNSIFRILSLNESNGYSVNLLVPSSEQDSYYCGVFVLPPDIENATFQYTIEGFRNVYDLDNASCFSLGDEDTTCSVPNSFCYDFHIPPSNILRNMCVFLHTTKQGSFTSAKIKTFSTLQNPLFQAPISVGVLLMILAVIAVIVLCCAYCKDSIRCTHVRLL